MFLVSFISLECAIILEYPIFKQEVSELILGIIFYHGGFHFDIFHSPYPWLLWLGVKPAGFITVDYFPLLPWPGVGFHRSVYRDIFFTKIIKDTTNFPIFPKTF
jgi:uncharacterized membrane protein